MADELAAEITHIEDIIKAEMTARNTDEMHIDIFKIRWSKCTSNRFDSTSFKKAMPEQACGTSLPSHVDSASLTAPVSC